MSMMKPDYFISHNGLPNILLTNSRQLITQSTTKCDRVTANQKIHPQAKTKRIITANQQALVQSQRDSEKNAKNRAIKESLRGSKSQKDLINSQIVNSGSWSRRTLSPSNCANNDNADSNRKNACRLAKMTSIDFRDNKLNQQRKYNNTIFRHDLPDRIVLPPLPI